jgi:hypothetical protein
VPRSPLDFVLGLARSAALEDLQVTLPAARAAAGLLRLTARDRLEREMAESACQALECALAMVRSAGRGPLVAPPSPEEEPDP